MKEERPDKNSVHTEGSKWSGIVKGRNAMMEWEKKTQKEGEKKKQVQERERRDKRMRKEKRTVIRTKGKERG